MAGSSLIQGLRRAVQLRSSAAAVVDSDSRFSWEELADRVARLAGAFVARGLEAGDRVALLALNSHRSLESFYAAIHAGGIIVPLNHRLADEELARLLADCSPAILVLGSEFEDRAEALLSALPYPVEVIRASDWERVLALASPVPDAGCADDDIACIFYTSGTTGEAKGVMLSHSNLNANTLNVLAELHFDTTTVHLHHGPLFHVAAAARLFSVTHVAGCHVFLPRFDPQEVIAAVSEARITVATFVPTMLRALLDDPMLTCSDMSSLELITYGSAPMPEPLLREVMAALPRAGFAQSYGMTELSPVATMLGRGDHLAGKGLLRSAGRAVTTAEVAIVDPDGRHLATGQRGEIIVRGPMVMQGYWNRPDFTAKVLRDGWMHTGDVGYLDEAGYLFVVDRIKDMIVTGGENVYSQEVEDCIATLPGVAECAVIGLPDPKWGEAVHAEVRVKSGHELDQDQIVAHCRQHLAGFKCPKSVRLRTTPFPLNGAQKISKADLRRETSHT